MKRNLNKSSSIIRHLIRIQNRGWDAIIAGAAIRDAYHDKDCGTVDILIKQNRSLVGEINFDYKTLDWMEYWFGLLHCDLDKHDDVIFLGDADSYGKLDPHICAVWHVITGGKKYQIIILKKDPIEYVKENFDFGICRAYCNGNRMHFTNDFIKDSMNHTITLYREHLSPRQITYATKEHAPALMKKYPGWKLVL